jgi:hypothetical protein
MSIASHGGSFFLSSVSVECAQSAAMGRDERDGARRFRELLDLK